MSTIMQWSIALRFRTLIARGVLTREEAVDLAVTEYRCWIAREG